MFHFNLDDGHDAIFGISSLFYFCKKKEVYLYNEATAHEEISVMLAFYEHSPWVLTITA